MIDFLDVIDLFIDGGLEIIANKKISKWIRYPLAVLITILFSLFITGLFILSFLVIKKSIIVGFIIFSISILFIFFIIKKMKKILNTKK